MDNSIINHVYEQGIIFLSNSNIEKAEEAFRAILGNVSDHHGALLGMALVEERLGRLGNAILYAGRAFEVNSSDYKVKSEIMRIGNIAITYVNQLLEQGQAISAIEVANSLVQVFPSDPAVRRLFIDISNQIAGISESCKLLLEGSFGNGFNHIVVSKYGPLLINKYDTFIGKSLQTKKSWCDEEIDLIKRIIKPGSYIYEIGANIGSHTIPLAKYVGDKGMIISFEPQRLIFNNLVSSVALNSLENVRCFQKAVGNCCGFIDIPKINYRSSENFGAISFVSSPIRHNTASFAENESVEVVTIDSINVSRCDLIKIDAEGMEYDIICGSTETINKFRPVVYAECHNNDYGRRFTSIMRMLKYNIYEHINLGNHNAICIPTERVGGVVGFNEITY